MKNNAVILLIDFDSSELESNMRLLSAYGYSILCARSILQAKEIIAKRLIDLYILEASLPDGDGYELCRTLRETKDAPIIFLSSRNTPADRIEAYSAGGDAYLSKPCNPGELIAITNRLLSRVSKERATHIITKSRLSLNTATLTATLDGKLVPLTQKEFLILLLLMQNENSAVPYEKIYEIIWHLDGKKNTGAIRTHISNLKSKIGTASTDDYDIISIHRYGYSFVTT